MELLSHTLRNVTDALHQIHFYKYTPETGPPSHKISEMLQKSSHFITPLMHHLWF